MNEDELRNALRAGEGDDAPDADALVSAVRGQRAQRRVRVLSAAATVVVVAGAAVLVAVLAGRGGGRQGGRPVGGPAPSAIASPVTRSGSDGTVGSGCPAGAPSTASSAPPGGTGSAATDGPMFAAPVRSILVCVYASTGTTTASPESVSLQDAAATALATGIEQASTVRLAVACPLVRSAESRRLALIATSTTGRVLPTVTTDISLPNCNHPITNGTAVRWNWQPPDSLTALIAGTRTGGGGADGGSGDGSGAPPAGSAPAPAGGASGSAGPTEPSTPVRLPVARPSGVDGSPAR